jgi:hypothetical protein
MKLGQLEIVLILGIIVVICLAVVGRGFLKGNRNVDKSVDRTVDKHVGLPTRVTPAGTSSSVFCVGCGERVNPTWSFCPKCSTKIV